MDTAISTEQAAAPPYPGMIRLGERLGLGAYLRAIWARRELAVNMPLGELRAQNMNTVMGNLWHLLNPVMLVGVYFVVFGLILKVGDRGIDNFLGFLTIGIFVFFYTRKSIQSAAKSITASSWLIQSIRFPRAILPLSAVIGETIALAPATAVLLLVILGTGERLHPAWLLVVPIFLLQGLFNLGLGFLSARLADHFQDVNHILPYLLSIWFYLSGVMYSEQFVTDPTALRIFRANPMYVFITLVREALMHGTTSVELWLVALAWTVPLLVVGFLYFRAREQEYGHG